MRERNTKANVCESESCWIQLGPLNIQASVHQNTGYFNSAVFVILLFTPCVAQQRVYAQGSLVPGECCALMWFRTALKDWWEAAKESSWDCQLWRFGPPPQSLDQPKTPSSSPGGDSLCRRLEEELEGGEAVSLPEQQGRTLRTHLKRKKPKQGQHAR